MTDSSTPGLGDLMALFGNSNPFGPITKSIDQFKRGVSEFLSAVENFNATMENLNAIAARVNGMLDEVEPAVHAFLPQVTRSIKAADAVITQISGPVERVAPGINRLAETLSSPVFAQMPDDISTFLNVLTDVSRRMQPLSQMAETAGGLFGLRSLTSLRGGSGRAPAPAPIASIVVEPSPPKRDAPKRAAPKRAPVKKAAAKKAAPKKKTAAKRAPAKKAR